jgi:hypothetical protein
MRKNLFLIGVLSLLLVGGIGTGYAAVSGPCADCHTMHNSQGGEPMGPTATTYPHLTLSSCIGCHSDANDIGPPVDKIYDDPDEDVCAGGSFDVWNTSDDDAKVHNVAISGLSITPDSVNTTTNGVPGLDTTFLTMNNLAGGSADPADLTCAGAYGCHGTINDNTITDPDAGIRGFHHGSSAYRYLKIEGTNADVIGTGSDDWEETGADGGNHNVYSADPNLGINKLCANCHPDFHGTDNTNDGANWTRHPTDNLLVTAPGWDLSEVTTDYKWNPFAWAPGSTVTTTSPYLATDTGASVACVSCHRAHGTPYEDLLRWGYSDNDPAQTQQAGSAFTQGCLGCHYKQR